MEHPRELTRNGRLADGTFSVNQTAVFLLVDDVYLLSCDITLLVEVATIIAYSYYNELATDGHPEI